MSSKSTNGLVAGRGHQRHGESIVGRRLPNPPSVYKRTLAPSANHKHDGVILRAIRPRTTAAKRFKGVNCATAMIWTMLRVAERFFQRLNAPELLTAVCVGARYVDGVMQKVVIQQEVAA